MTTGTAGYGGSAVLDMPGRGTVGCRGLWHDTGPGPGALAGQPVRLSSWRAALRLPVGTPASSWHGRPAVSASDDIPES